MKHHHKWGSTVYINGIDHMTEENSGKIRRPNPQVSRTVNWLTYRFQLFQCGHSGSFLNGMDMLFKLPKNQQFSMFPCFSLTLGLPS